MTQETIERTFRVPSPANLTLSNIRGSVDIQSGDDGSISVIAVKHLESGDAKRTTIEMDQAADGSLKVRTQYMENNVWLFRSSLPCKVDYTIRIPSTCSLSISGVSNSATISGVNGPVSIKSVSGLVKLSDIHGNLKANTVSGTLSAKTLSGSLQANTVSGQIQIRQSNLESVITSTVSGDVILETNLGTGPYHFKAISGNVKIKLPESSGYAVQTKSISGRVKTSNQTNGNFSRGVKKVNEKGDGVTIHHSSISGNLHIDSGLTSVVEENTYSNAPPQNQSNKRTEILDRIAAGEISVEDALASLKLD
jgi:predicted membrane protein